MFRKALMTLFVLGATSSAALARPITVSAGFDVNASWSTGPDVRDHRLVDDRYDDHHFNKADLYELRHSRRFDGRFRTIQPRWAMLSEINRIGQAEYSRKLGMYVGRSFVNLDGAVASSLMIQANGPMMINQIAVEYFDRTGRMQTMVLRDLQVVLDGRNRTYTFGIGGTVKLNRIVVYGRNGAFDSGFSVLGL